jgi:hypothetical protein
MMRLTHEQTLSWIHQHQAWRLVRKTKPMWARSVTAHELGKSFQTADGAVERAQEGYWLCVGVVGEPWFQKWETIEAKYEHTGKEAKHFSFDAQPENYQVFRPRGDVRNWAAMVRSPGIEGFTIQPSYDMEHPLYSPAGGYVVKDYVPDPYRDEGGNLWLVQRALFESTYEFLPPDEGTP